MEVCISLSSMDFCVRFLMVFVIESILYERKFLLCQFTVDMILVFPISKMDMYSTGNVL
jgi:hypothetical protein